MRNKTILEGTQKTELAELQKMVKRDIRNDCTIFEHQRTRKIIEETWST